ncbi:capsular polysaccharide synthesis protein [Acinetobacter ihumii]|uniref:capsular polysaccharide synthesis protein n=1 Tax=Acinetobacter ihumii TaxID=2483802 RepID=UPI001D180AA3|nr:capsular polysaccharide synthesis protein [Acinetobacter ihumii]
MISEEKCADVMYLFSEDSAQTKRLKRLKKQPWRTFYSTFTTKKFRKAQAREANLLQKKHVARQWDFFIDQYLAGQLNHFKLEPKINLGNEKIIWQYWGQGIELANENETVQLCFASVDKFKGDYKVIRLDENTIKDYLDLPDFVWERKQNPYFKPAFFADLIRLALLDIYGGIWIDATILLTNQIDKNILNQDFFMFQRSANAENKDFWIAFNSDYFGWSDEHFVNILNSFIVAKKNNEIIHTCLNIMLNYWKTQKDIPHYFFFQIMMNELLKKNTFNVDMLILDDTLPHLLQTKMKEPFNSNGYDRILKDTNIHKINYIKEADENSYFYQLKNLLG